MNKKFTLSTTVALMILAAAMTFSVTMIFVFRLGFSSSIPDSAGGTATEQKLKDLDRLVSDNFYTDADEKALADGIAAGFIAGLDDKYSAYMSAESYAKEKQDTMGKSVGVGINIMLDESGYILVESVTPETPAAEAGVQAGDLIVKAGGQDVKEIGYDAAYEQLIGEVGTRCVFTVRRDGEDLEIDVIRREYDALSIYARMIGTVGYIKITGFHDNTPDQFEKALDSLREENPKGLVFDLRGNGGGTLDSVAKMLDILLPEGDIVSAAYKGGKTEVLYTSDANEIDLPMNVLINSGTASASELFAAALRDYNKGKLVGENSYGKGVMQRTYELDDGSAVKITIALFNPPSGGNFNGKGLAPDIEVLLTDEQRQNFLSLTDEEDPQLQAAVKDLG